MLGFGFTLMLGLTGDKNAQALAVGFKRKLDDGVDSREEAFRNKHQRLIRSPPGRVLLPASFCFLDNTTI